MSINSGPVGLNSTLINSIGGLQQDISTGSRINQAKDDPAGIQVTIEFSSQIRGNNVAMRNSNDGISALQVAEGSLNNVTDSLQRIRELTVQAGNGTLSNTDRSALQNEADQLLEGIRDSIGNSEFNGKSLLKNDEGVNIQTGAGAGEQQNIRTMDFAAELEDLDLFNLDLTNPDTSAAFESLDGALSLAGELRSEFGASQNRLEYSMDSLMSENLNETAARSRISDTDMAKAISELYQNQVKQQAEIAMLGQANSSRGHVLSLLNT
jgi:flagellin